MKPPYCPICGDGVVEVRIDPDRIQLEPCGHAVTDTTFWERAQRWLQATDDADETAPLASLDGGEQGERDVSDDAVGEHDQWNKDPAE